MLDNTVGVQAVKKYVLIPAVLMLVLPATHACLWVSGTTREGQRVSVSGISPARRLQKSLATSGTQYAIERNIALKGDTAMERRNNVAVDMIYRGRIPEAIEALKELEAEQPGDYVTAANLGTAYELAGKNEDALHWIKEAIRRNKDSHWKTEWLHVDILEAKLKAANDPEFFKRRF